MKEQGLLQNYNNVQPNFIDYNTKFDELFKSQEENYDEELEVQKQEIKEDLEQTEEQQ